MKTIRIPFDEPITPKRIFDFYFEGFSFGVFDIETTGLMPLRDSLILSGFVTSTESGSEVLQFFAEDPQDEKEIIEATIDLVNRLDFLITYNGRFFDIPFMKKRALKYGLTFPDKFNLDLFNIFRHYSELPNFLPSLSQKTLEEFAGIDPLREDRISGYESVALYNQYFFSHSAELEEKILLHNKDDVKQLYRLIGLLKHSNLHRALTRQGFPIEKGKITGISFKNQELLIKGIYDEPMDYISFPTPDAPYSFRMNGTSGDFDFAIPCEKEKGITYLDGKAILGDYIYKLDSYPGISKGYLIIKENSEVNYQEINYFAKELVPLVFNSLGIRR